jgi:hypothetical protein
MPSTLPLTAMSYITPADGHHIHLFAAPNALQER